VTVPGPRDPATGAETIVPVDLTGYMIRCVFRRTADPTDAVVRSTENGGVTILDQTANKGRARVNILPLHTAALEKHYQWEAQFTDPAGTVRTPAEFSGTAVIRRDIA
jgi:hypothetical protein